MRKNKLKNVFMFLLSAASGKSVTYYRFPKDTAHRKLWEIFCNREDAVNVKDERICSLHFKEVDFERNLKFEMGKLHPIFFSVQNFSIVNRI